jgi:hypothetical protein
MHTVELESPMYSAKLDYDNTAFLALQVFYLSSSIPTALQHHKVDAQYSISSQGLGTRPVVGHAPEVHAIHPSSLACYFLANMKENRILASSQYLCIAS